MTLSPEDRERIVEAMAKDIFACTWPDAPWEAAYGPSRKVYVETAANYLDAALSAGLADAIRAKALEDAAAKIRGLGPSHSSLRLVLDGFADAILALRNKETNG